MLRGLQGKMIKFSMFDMNGKWLGNGTGKVMLVDRGKSIAVSIREHPNFEPQKLVQLFPWEVAGRYQVDVIIKKWEEEND